MHDLWEGYKRVRYCCASCIWVVECMCICVCFQMTARRVGVIRIMASYFCLPEDCIRLEWVSRGSASGLFFLSDPLEREDCGTLKRHT